MEKLTVLVKGNIYYKEYGCTTWIDSVIAGVAPNDYPNPSLIIEGDLNIDNFVCLDERIRLVATGKIETFVSGRISWGQSFDGTKELYTAKHISAKGTFNG